MEPPSTLSKFFKVLVILDLVALNFFVVYLVRKPQPIPTTQVITQQIITQTTPVPTPKYIPVPTPTPVVVYKTTTAPKTKVRSVYYVSIPGSGSTQAQTWQDVAGSEFYFDTADYPGLVEVYFEANMYLFNGSGQAYAQLLDVTHGIGVQGSDVKTNVATSTPIVSGKVSFWAGKNLIRVQIKSLTSETTVFTSGRLRIVTEN